MGCWKRKCFKCGEQVLHCSLQLEQNQSASGERASGVGELSLGQFATHCRQFSKIQKKNQSPKRIQKIQVYLNGVPHAKKNRLLRDGPEKDANTAQLLEQENCQLRGFVPVRVHVARSSSVRDAVAFAKARQLRHFVLS